jgi:hypothetical protein
VGLDDAAEHETREQNWREKAGRVTRDTSSNASKMWTPHQSKSSLSAQTLARVKVDYVVV